MPRRWNTDSWGVQVFRSLAYPFEDGSHTVVMLGMVCQFEIATSMISMSSLVPDNPTVMFWAFDDSSIYDSNSVIGDLSNLSYMN